MRCRILQYSPNGPEEYEGSGLALFSMQFLKNCPRKIKLLGSPMKNPNACAPSLRVRNLSSYVHQHFCPGRRRHRFHISREFCTTLVSSLAHSLFLMLFYFCEHLLRRKWNQQINRSDRVGKFGSSCTSSHNKFR